MWQSQSILSRALHFKTALYDIYYAHLNLGMLGPETILLTNNVLKFFPWSHAHRHPWQAPTLRVQPASLAPTLKPTFSGAKQRWPGRTPGRRKFHCIHSTAKNTKHLWRDSNTITKHWRMNTEHKHHVSCSLQGLSPLPSRTTFNETLHDGLLLPCCQWGRPGKRQQNFSHSGY